MGILIVVNIFYWTLLFTRVSCEPRGGKAYIEVSLYDKDANGDYVEKNKSILEGNFTPAGVTERAQGSLKQVSELSFGLLNLLTASLSATVLLLSILYLPSYPVHHVGQNLSPFLCFL